MQRISRRIVPPPAWPKGGVPRRIRRTKGELNSKLHAACDGEGEGKPLILRLTESQVSDYCEARAMLTALPGAETLIAGRGDDSKVCELFAPTQPGKAVPYLQYGTKCGATRSKEGQIAIVYQGIADAHVKRLGNRRMAIGGWPMLIILDRGLVPGKPEPDQLTERLAVWLCVLATDGMLGLHGRGRGDRQHPHRSGGEPRVPWLFSRSLRRNAAMVRLAQGPLGCNAHHSTAGAVWKPVARINRH
ncbi:MAG: hypothetical protein AAFU49_00830 [Pseudomonadota bacterium]